MNKSFDVIDDILVIDTGGEPNCTITKRAFHVTDIHEGHKTALFGYQDKGKPTVCSIVNGLTKAKVRGRNEPVIFHVNYATLVEDQNEMESLCVPFRMMSHGIQCDLTPTKYGGKGGIQISNDFFPFEFDDEKLYFRISKPSLDDLNIFEHFELTSLLPTQSTRRNKKKLLPSDIPMIEWRKRLAMAPEDVVTKTLENTTQFYLNCPGENRDVPQRHYKTRFPGLRYPRQREGVATDTFFPSLTSDRGNTCSQFFVGLKSNRWEVFPLKSECYNDIALKDYARKCGLPEYIKSDNALSETGDSWTSYCRDYCISQQTTEPGTTSKNQSESWIGQLETMVKRVTR